jgi:hypothetical protein
MKNSKQPSKIVYLDFDDFSEKNHRLDLLWQLHDQFDNFKVNLFTIPTKVTPAFLEYLNQPYLKHWIQLCVHGFYHKNNEEVSEQDFKRIEGKYAKVYRAPYWQLSDVMYERLKKLGYKIMIHPDDPRQGIKYNWNTKDSPPFLKVLYGHGHVQNICDNGIEQSMENILKLPKDTEFKFL